MVIDAFELFLGAIALGAVHGIEPGHGWPVAASYALEQTNKWFYGLAASLLLGIGHLISSIAMVMVFFYAKAYFSLTQVNEPLTILGDIPIGGPVSLVAGFLLIALGIREYRHGHTHSDSAHDHDHDHSPAHNHEHGHERNRDHDHVDPHGHSHSHDHTDDTGLLTRIARVLPFGHGHGHDHTHGEFDEAADRGLIAIAWFAFVLGFAHEEEFEIIALCAGSTHCLELMATYAITVIVGIITLTLVLIAGYERFEERVERYTEYLPAFSATVLIIMGAGFITGLF